MKPVDNSIPPLNLPEHDFNTLKKIYSEAKSTDSVEISNTAKVYDRLDKFLNLGRPDRLDISDLSDSEKKVFLKMLAELIQRGIVGHEVLEVNGKPEKHYIVNHIGDERIQDTKLYKKKGYYED
ncbi:MAG: hypothetical protein CVV24_09700 [Ignavibacteriae bacterium HGW-Ignavibacteriae-3]|nr:MAG: hypothetical protein CVV24_09700 [Ignavibacteriae bacterium HGW-Ignavibacteriae-3]